MDCGSRCSCSHRRWEPGGIQPLGLLQNTLLGRLGSTEASCLPGPVPACGTQILHVFPVWPCSQFGVKVVEEEHMQTSTGCRKIAQLGTALCQGLTGDAAALSTSGMAWPAGVGALGGEGQHGSLVGWCADLGEPWSSCPRVPAPRPACPRAGMSPPSRSSRASEQQVSRGSRLLGGPRRWSLRAAGLCR